MKQEKAGERNLKVRKKEGQREKYEGRGKGTKTHSKEPQKPQFKENRHDKQQKEAGKLCSVSDKCGGCQWIGLSYQEQLVKKTKYVHELLKEFGKPEPIVGMQQPMHYRNKVHAVFGEDRKHQPVSGIYEKNSHRIVPMDACMIEDEKADDIIVAIRNLMKSFKYRPYNEDTGHGLLRHVLIRTGHFTGQIMVVLVLASPILPSKNNFVKALLKLFPEITTIVLNVNDKQTSMVLGEREQVLYGPGYIEDKLCGKVFRISPKSFYQVNPVQTGILYQTAVEFAGLTGRETVIDAYCGTGTIGIIASEKAKQVIGVELNPDAIKDARINAKQNSVRNIDFYQKDAGEFMAQMAEQDAKADVVFLDPPRSGSSDAFLNSLAKLKPQRVVYISCNPETLARDLRVLKKKGYEVKRMVPVDMFPWTGHCEVCVKLVKIKG